MMDKKVKLKRNEKVNKIAVCPVVIQCLCTTVNEFFFLILKFLTHILSPDPKTSGARLCTKATEVGPRIKVTSEAY